jgi:hypothetical protein
MSIPEIITLHIGLSGHGFSKDEEALDTLTEILAARFPSFSITEGTGFFRGHRERTFTAMIATPEPQEVANAASVIRESLDQDGVGIGYRGYYFRATKLDIPDLKASLSKLL